MVDPTEWENKSFKNDYLKNVAFELRFPSNVRIIKEYYKFQEQITEKYPKYGEDLTFIGIPEEMQPPETLRTYSFMNDETQSSVKVSIDKFTYVTKQYIKYDEFKAEILWLFSIFKEIFNIKSCSRIGLRYTNVYQLKQDLDESIEIYKQLFEPFHNTNKFQYTEMFVHNIEIRRRISEEVILSYRSQFQKNNTTKIYFHVLDFDCYIAETFSMGEYEDKLDEIRKIEKHEFLLTVTQEFMDKMHPIE